MRMDSDWQAFGSIEFLLASIVHHLHEEWAAVSGIFEGETDVVVPTRAKDVQALHWVTGRIRRVTLICARVHRREARAAALLGNLQRCVSWMPNCCFSVHR